jgi:predicted nucleic acid-binding protein
MQTTFEIDICPPVAESAGAEVLYSDDLATGHRDGTIQVVNPLAE